MEILLSEAEHWVKPKRSKIYADARTGILSTTKDTRRGNRKVVDTAELQRVYGQLQNPEMNAQESTMNGNGLPQMESSEMITLLQEHVQTLTAQLELANERETALIDEKAKLLDLLAVEKEEKLALMPPKTERLPFWRCLFPLRG